MRLAAALCLIGFAWASVDRSSHPHVHRNKAPRVDLGYATYEGTTKASGINEFLGMRFASHDMLT
jgi:hypothetical protein